MQCLWASIAIGLSFGQRFSSALAAIAGILIALDVDMTPTFGLDYLLYGVVATIIGGVGSYRGLVFGSLLLASAQHLAAYYIDTKWMVTIQHEAQKPSPEGEGWVRGNQNKPNHFILIPFLIPSS